ncbi:hypothetical protein CF336_g7332 [Tilletia laevis]|nr:hypothetical protein CF336_g7332 [Tilletia laevis]
MAAPPPYLDPPIKEKANEDTADIGSIPDSVEQSEVEAEIRHSIIEHRVNDPNLDPDIIDQAESALEKGNLHAELKLEDALHDDSIYPEVRAAVSNVDDPTMPVNTFRAWFIGLVFSVLLSGLNEFFSYRYPSVSISSLVAQVVVFPVGVFFAKEHTLITIMANVSYSGAYATYDLGAQRFFYGQHWGAGYRILLVLSSQIIGFSYAGFCRRWLVWPAAMIWPGNLVQTALLTTFHRQKGVEPGQISREKYFLYLFGAASSTIGSPATSSPHSAPSTGPVGSPLTTYIIQPMITPWFTSAQILISFVFWMWFVAPLMYYNNFKNTAYLPFVTNSIYDRFGDTYSTKKVFTAEGTFDAAAYNDYSQQWLPVVTMINFGLQFASVASIFTHVFFYFRKDLARQWKASLKQEPDIHARLMSRYAEVPNWWYMATFAASFAMALAAILVWPTRLPWWALIVALLISAVFTLPAGLITAITNLQIGLNVPSELIVGYMLPGHPVAMMIFKTFGYVAAAQGISFVSDLKLGHYMKIPPRTMFTAQVIATSLAAIVVIGVQAWVFGNIRDVCTKKAQDGFQCPGVITYGSSSIIWGLIGPRYNFSAGQPYNFLLYFFLLGALMPIPTYILTKRFPRSVLRYVYWPVLFIAAANTAPATGPNFVMGAFVAWIFQSYLRRHHFKWWSSYNYITEAALDVGTGLCTIVIFFTVVFVHGKNTAFTEGNWWGNTVQYNTTDANYVSWLTPPADGFAPAPGGTRYAAAL